MDYRNFNSQPHKEADQESSKSTNNSTKYFNSQPHKEADVELMQVRQFDWKFQLTASQGGWRLIGTIAPDTIVISTHSLTRRLTWLSFRRISPAFISTHSLTRRLTACQYSLKLLKSYFNSQPHKEADGRKRDSMGRYSAFQLTASQGGWLYWLLLLYSLWTISTNSLTRRLTNIPWIAGLGLAI